MAAATASRDEERRQGDGGGQRERGRGRGGRGLGRRRRRRGALGGVRVVVLVEAQPVHVALDGLAVVVFQPVAQARGQLGGFLLPPQDVDGVLAAGAALFAVEHGAAVVVVVLEGGGAEGVGGADPLGHAAGYDGLVDGLNHLGAADLGAEFLVLAVLVAAVALERNKSKEAVVMEMHTGFFLRSRNFLS